MPRNRVQHQKGLSGDAFEQRYPDEEACRKAWFAWRWPEGFKCPRCAATEYSLIQERQLLQCRRCRYQTSLIAGTILQGTKLAHSRSRTDGTKFRVRPTRWAPLRRAPDPAAALSYDRGVYFQKPKFADGKAEGLKP